MRTPTPILALAAAGTSLALHALLFSAFRVITVPTALPPPAELAAAEMPVFFEPPAPPPDAPPEPEFVIGESDARGYASHHLPGAREALAPEAPVDQAALSLDEVGRSPAVETPEGKAGDAAADAAPPPTRTVLPTLAQLVEVLQQQLPPPAEPVTQDRAAIDAQEDPAPVAQPAPAPPSQPALVPVPRQSPVLVPQPAPRPMPAPPARMATAGAEADPAPKSESESDPFSMLGTADYRDGRLTVRAGRKVRSRRPKIGLAGQVDLYQRREARVTLRVRTDAAGNVTAVEVVRSSGSNEIDQPCLVAMYDWWFEPKKDAAGRPVPDVFDFTIGFR